MRRLMIDVIEGIVPADRRAWFIAWGCGFIDCGIVVALYIYWPRG